MKTFSSSIFSRKLAIQAIVVTALVSVASSAFAFTSYAEPFDNLGIYIIQVFALLLGGWLGWAVIFGCVIIGIWEYFTQRQANVLFLCAAGVVGVVLIGRFLAHLSGAGI